MYNEFILVLLLAGKNPTNLKVHLETIHAAVFTQMETVSSKSPSTSKSTRPAPRTSASTAVTHKRMEQFIVKPQTATEIARQQRLAAEHVHRNWNIYKSHGLRAASANETFQVLVQRVNFST